MTTHALVLGGGGVVGIAWETGLLVGQAQAGIDVRNADLFQRTIFKRNSGVELVDAVLASCAVPYMWPPATINRRRYIDGGCYSVK